MLQRIKKVAGSSAGAICAGLVAVGCNPQEIADVFRGNIKHLFHGYYYDYIIAVVVVVINMFTYDLRIQRILRRMYNSTRPTTYDVRRTSHV